MATNSSRLPAASCTILWKNGPLRRASDETGGQPGDPHHLTAPAPPRPRGGVGHGSKEPVQLSHHNDGLALLGSREKPAAGGTAGQRLAGANSRIFEYLGEVQSLHRAVGSDALALGCETKA